MRHHYDTKLIAGVLIWITIITSVIMVLRGYQAQSPRTFANLMDYATAQRGSVEIVSKREVVIGIGDPVFLEHTDGLRQVGIVTDFDFDEGAYFKYHKDRPNRRIRLAWVNRATVTFFHGTPTIGPAATVELNATDTSPAWVVKTMLSPAMREKITQLILTAYNAHQKELVQQFRPIIEKTIVDSTHVIRSRIGEELDRRREKIAAIRQRYRRDVIYKELLPVIQAEVWPIVKEEASPLVEKMGREVWQEVSVWRFGWRFIYDQSPLPAKSLSKREFDNFVKNKALPIFESHFEDMVEIQKSLVKRLLANENITAKFSETAQTFLSDPEIQALFTDVFRSAVVDNPELKNLIEQAWRSPEARRVMRVASDRLGSTVTDIGQALFGSSQGEIPAEFARVLRNRVLHKDDRWLILKPGDTDQQHEGKPPVDEIPMTVAAQPSEFPIELKTGPARKGAAAQTIGGQGAAHE